MKRVCALSELGPRASVRFELRPVLGRYGPVAQEGFAILAPDGLPRTYLNVCPHRGQPVDCGDGRLWLPDGNLECGAHGAVFDPTTGACLSGPGKGRGLQPLRCAVEGGAVLVDDALPEGRDDDEAPP